MRLRAHSGGWENGSPRNKGLGPFLGGKKGQKLLGAQKMGGPNPIFPGEKGFGPFKREEN